MTSSKPNWTVGVSFPPSGSTSLQNQYWTDGAIWLKDQLHWMISEYGPEMTSSEAIAVREWTKKLDSLLDSGKFIPLTFSIKGRDFFLLPPGRE